MDTTRTRIPFARGRFDAQRRQHPGGTMRKIIIAAALSAAFGSAAYAQTQQDLLRDGNGGNTDNVLTYGMGYHQQRYSPLKQVDKTTVKRLVPVWSLSLTN